MTASVSETAAALDDFAAQWTAWHRRQEARLADPHGFLGSGTASGTSPSEAASTRCGGTR